MNCTYTYMYSSGPRTVDNVESIEVRADGSHTLIDADNVRHRMEAGWLYYGHPTDPAFQAQEPVAPVVLTTVEPFVAAAETPSSIVTATCWVSGNDPRETLETLPAVE